MVWRAQESPVPRGSGWGVMASRGGRGIGEVAMPLSEIRWSRRFSGKTDVCPASHTAALRGLTFAVDVYDVPSKPSDPEPEADGAADERLAEEFRRQFLDDVAQRQLKKKKTTQPARPGTEDVLKGPKLGGSRNVRAAMRDMLLKKEKEGKK